MSEIVVRGLIVDLYYDEKVKIIDVAQDVLKIVGLCKLHRLFCRFCILKVRIAGSF